jgi:hypothetical protein
MMSCRLPPNVKITGWAIAYLHAVQFERLPDLFPGVLFKAIATALRLPKVTRLSPSISR